MAELCTKNNKNERISDLVDWCAKNDQLAHLFSSLFKLSDSRLKISFVFAPSLISGSLFQSKKKIDHLTNMI